MGVEGPAHFFGEFFGGGFSDVVQQSRPAQPQIIGGLTNVIDHLKGVIKIVFMGLPFDFFNTF